MPGGPFLAEVIPEALDGERVDRVLSMLVPCSRSEAVASVSAGQVSIDGAVVSKAAQRVVSGERIELLVDPVAGETAVVADPSVEFGIVHVDDDIIVVDKPPGLVVHPGAGHRSATLVHGLLARFPDLDPDSGVVVGERLRPGLVHRLDRGTSGLVVVARTPKAHRSLVAQLQTHSVERVYTALVRGRPEHEHGIIDAPIGRSRRDPLRMAVVADGRPARTRYDVAHPFHADDRGRPTEVTLLTCHLETGRTHQIRVHLASIGHPVVGDDRYGGPDRRPHTSRPFLHARELSFVHPGSSEQVSFTSPLPDDLASVLAALRPLAGGRDGLFDPPHAPT